MIRMIPSGPTVASIPGGEVLAIAGSSYAPTRGGYALLISTNRPRPVFVRTPMWSALELRHVDLSDRRLNRRLVKLVDDLLKTPEASVPQSAGDWAGTKAAYRFRDNNPSRKESLQSIGQALMVPEAAFFSRTAVRSSGPPERLPGRGIVNSGRALTYRPDDSDALAPEQTRDARFSSDGQSDSDRQKPFGQ